MGTGNSTASPDGYTGSKDLQMRNFSLKFEIRICCNVSYPGKRNISSLMYSGKPVAGLPAKPTRYRPYAGLLMRNMQGSYVANNTFHALDQGIQYYQFNNTGVFNTDINENTFNNCGVGLTIAPLQNPYNLSLPLNPYGVLQQVTFNCNHFNNGIIGFIGCGEIPVHGSSSNGTGNEFNNVNIANGVWGGTDTLKYYYYGAVENPEIILQPTQVVVCNGDIINNDVDNKVSPSPASFDDLCNLTPSPLSYVENEGDKRAGEILVYPNPTFDGRIHIKLQQLNSLNYSINSVNGTFVSRGFIDNNNSDIILPQIPGLYFVVFYKESKVIARYKLLRI
jgi:hypothetical protein